MSAASSKARAIVSTPPSISLRRGAVIFVAPAGFGLVSERRHAERTAMRAGPGLEILVGTIRLDGVSISGRWQGIAWRSSVRKGAWRCPLDSPGI